MKKVLFTCACLAVCSGFSAPTARMDRSKLLIGAYCFNKAVSDEVHVKEVKDCGVDFIIGVNAQDRATLDLFAKYGLGVVANNVLNGWWGGDGKAAGQMRKERPRAVYEQQLAKYVAALDHPAIWMIDLCDEPSALDLAYLGETCQLIRQRVPQAPAYLNLYPNYASVSQNTGAQTVNQLGTATYPEHIDVYCREVPLDYISYDFYVYTPNARQRPTLYGKMYDNFNVVAEACRRTGRSFWYIPQVNSHMSPTFEPTSENRLRFQAFTAMAFGAEAINWACWTPGWWTNNVYNAAGQRSPQYEKLQKVNAELHRLGPAYMRLRNVATHYVGFTATNGLERLNGKVSFLSVLDTGYFHGVRTREGTPLLVGEMVARGADDGTRALFVVPSGDPYDSAPAVRTVVFRSWEGRAVQALGPDGPIAPVREADGAYALRLPENSCALIVTK